jgi:hypothetical protein
LRRCSTANSIGSGRPGTVQGPQRPKVLDGQEDWLREQFIRHRRNADVVRQELIAETGIAVSLKTLYRAVHPCMQALKAEALVILLLVICILTT